MKTWLVLTLARSQASLQTQREEWWAAGHTQMNVWDHSWLTPRLVCGFRFMRVPPGISLDKGIFLPITVGSEESANQSGQVPVAEKLMLWTFDGTGFQDRAVQYFAGGVPPMEDVWLLALVAAVPATFTSNVMSGSDMMELQCAAMVLLSSYIYAEYMAMLVPPAVLLKYFQHTWEVHTRAGAVESASEMLVHFASFEPLERAMQRFQGVLEARRAAFACAFADDDCPPAAAPFGGTPVTRPLVDVVVTRCAEDLSWLAAWLARILRDEWTPEVAGMRVRLVIYEKCPSGASKNQELDGQQLLDWMLRLGVIHPGSTAIELTEPEGFENVAYVHYCMTAKWRDSDFVIFLHGSPFDHTNERMLDDVLRSMAQGTYGVPFVHLNIKRLPRVAVEPCLQALIRPALAAWQAERSQGILELPFDMSTYCCTQFVVARHRLDGVPDAFWRAVWRSLHQRLSVNGTAVEGLHTACRLPAQRVYEQRTQRNGHTPVADYGLWGEVLERAWHWIFGEDPVLPSREADTRLPLFLRIPRVRTDAEGGPRGTILDRVSIPDWGFDPGFWGLPPIIANVTGQATTPSASPIPTSHFARTARPNWRLPEWAELWLQEDAKRRQRVAARTASHVPVGFCSAFAFQAAC
ncbi:unnamed protein product [Effrenium voratum]|uniref:Uncharacterized protein n=1 Tax=Effrenium voratum TaxID=2562239 RepID=A0AA36I9A9_9DINO|nr:unnamed protein product [Effrenium voratum]CAJ1428252.1 unnamed protein product [Effrenium voratum]